MGCDFREPIADRIGERVDCQEINGDATPGLTNGGWKRDARGAVGQHLQGCSVTLG